MKLSLFFALFASFMAMTVETNDIDDADALESYQQPAPPKPGDKCPKLGQQVCVSKRGFVTCTSGNVWTPIQRCGSGTFCQPYPGNRNYVLCGYGYHP